jgi:cytochrome c-type biogenesis protein CcmH
MIHLNNRLSLWFSGISVPLWWSLSLQNSPQRYKDPQRHREQIQRLSILATLFCLFFFSSLISFAKEAQPNEDPQIAARMKNLTEQLRCLVCQNETLADSRADLAEDLRKQVREQIKAGKSDQEIIAYLTQRYGDFVLYNPPVKSTTYLLWFGPFALLILGTTVLFLFLKRRRELIQEQPLTADEHRRAEEILRSA